MTSAEIAMLFIAAAGSLGTIAAVILSNRDTKRTMAIAWGEMKQEVKGNSEQIREHAEILQQHTSDIGYLKGRANGKAAGVN